MAIYNTKYYILEKKQKDSFGNWKTMPKRYIVKGEKARNEQVFITGQFNPAFMVGNPSYRLLDGHIPPYCPVVDCRQALDWLDNNRFQLVEILNKD